MMILIQSHLKALPSHPHGQTAFLDACINSVSAKFGVGLVGGVIAGAFLSAAASGRLSWQSFEGPAHFGRFAAGASLMGFGGVLQAVHNWCGPIGHSQPQHCANHRTFGHRIWRSDHTSFGGCYSIDLRIRWTRYHTAPTTGRVISAVSAPLVIPTTSAKG